MRDAEQAIELKPDWVKGFFRKAAALEKLGRLEEALTDIKTARTIEPGNKEVFALQKVIVEKLSVCSPALSFSFNFAPTSGQWSENKNWG